MELEPLEVFAPSYYSTEAAECMAASIRHRILFNSDVLRQVLKFDHNELKYVIDDVAERYAYSEEIGTSDVSCAVRSVVEELTLRANYAALDAAMRGK